MRTADAGWAGIINSVGGNAVGSSYVGHAGPEPFRAPKDAWELAVWIAITAPLVTRRLASQLAEKFCSGLETLDFPRSWRDFGRDALF